MIIKFENNNEVSYLKHFNRIGDVIELVVVLDPKEATRHTEQRLKTFNYFYKKAKIKAITLFHDRVHHPLKVIPNTIYKSTERFSYE